MTKEVEWSFDRGDFKEETILTAKEPNGTPLLHFWTHLSRKNCEVNLYLGYRA